MQVRIAAVDTDGNKLTGVNITLKDGDKTITGTKTGNITKFEIDKNTEYKVSVGNIPAGLCLPDEMRVFVNGEGNIDWYNFYNEKGETSEDDGTLLLEFNKTSYTINVIDEDTVLSGAEFDITINGETQPFFADESGAYKRIGDPINTPITLRMTKPPAGYSRPREAIEFMLGEDGKIILAGDGDEGEAEEENEGEPLMLTADEPTDEPTPAPTDEPTPAPTDEPTDEPEDEPTEEPDAEPEDDSDENSIDIDLSRNAVQFYVPIKGTKFFITYEENGRTHYFDDEGITEFVSSGFVTYQLGGFVSDVEYTVTFTYVDEAYEKPDNFTFKVDRYGGLEAEPVDGKVYVKEDGNLIMFMIRAIDDRDGDGNHEIDTNDDGVYEGSDPDRGKSYLPDGNGDYIEVTGPDGNGNYTDKDGNKYTPVDKDGDGKYDSVNIDYKDKAPSSGSDNKTYSEPPKTGDNSNMLLWFVLLAASGCALGVLTVCSKKATNSK